MIWWLRVRAAGPLASVSAAVLATVMALTGVVVPLPALLGGVPVTVPLPLVLPLAVAIALASGLDRADPLLERTAHRHPRRYDLALAGILVGVCLGFCLGFGVAPQASPQVLLLEAVGRNCLGYVALTMLGAGLLPRGTAALPAVGWAITASLLGRETGGRIAAWAWPVAPGDQTSAWVICTLIGVAAVPGYLLAAPRPTMTAPD